MSRLKLPQAEERILELIAEPLGKPLTRPMELIRRLCGHVVALTPSSSWRGGLFGELCVRSRGNVCGGHLGQERVEAAAGNAAVPPTAGAYDQIGGVADRASRRRCRIVQCSILADRDHREGSVAFADEGSRG